MRNSRCRYTLEELLQAKRAEKPSPEFWNAFENDLRLRQRRLLQRQPVEDLGNEVTVWNRFRYFGALCGAAASCGIVGFVIVQLLNPTVVVPSVGEFETSFPQDVATFEVDSIPGSSERASVENTFFEVSLPEATHLAAADAKFESSNRPAELVLNTATTVSPIANSYTLEIETPFESINIDETIAFNADENITSKLMEKYIHPLSDRGWKYTQFVINQTDPLNRVSAMALESKLFDSDSRSDVKWNALTLKF